MIKILQITIGLDKRRLSFNGDINGPDRGAAGSAVSAAADLITMVQVNALFVQDFSLIPTKQI
jgi:hypothetical protein